MSASARCALHACMCERAVRKTRCSRFWPRAAVMFAKGRGPSLAVKGTRRRWLKRVANGEHNVCAIVLGALVHLVYWAGARYNLKLHQTGIYKINSAKHLQSNYPLRRSYLIITAHPGIRGRGRNFKEIAPFFDFRPLKMVRMQPMHKLWSNTRQTAEIYLSSKFIKWR